MQIGSRGRVLVASWLKPVSTDMELLVRVPSVSEGVSFSFPLLHSMALEFTQLYPNK